MMRSPRAGDSPERAVTALLDRHGDHIYGLGLRLCGNREDAQDLVQDTFLLAYRKWHQFRGDSEPGTWLYRIAARVCGRHRRLRAGAPARLDSLDELLPSQERGVVDFGAEATPPDELLARSEVRDRVEDALAALPPKFRMPLALKELMELSVEEVAAILNLKPATVKTRLHRARLYLAKQLRRALPQRPAPHPDHSKQMCLDLLAIKQDSMDRGVAFPVPQQELCTRCRSLFSTLDLARDLCLRLQGGEMPGEVRDLLLANLSVERRRPPLPLRRK